MSYYWNYKNVLKTTGQVIFYSSFIYFLPIILALFFKEGYIVSLIYFSLFLIQFIFGFLLIKSVKSKALFGITIAQSLIVVILTWLLFTLFSSLPFYFLSDFTLLDSFFEAMSAITTTGLSFFKVIPHLKSLIVWRSFLSWIGGLGIILLAYFGLTKGLMLSSSKLVAAEGHERLRPSIKKTVFNLWLIYFILTILGTFFLKVFGMSLFDAFNYAMSTISTTGTDSNIAGLASIGNTSIYIVIIVLMILGATSFILHFKAYRKKNFLIYFKDYQFLIMLGIILSSFLFIFIKLGKIYNPVVILLNVVGTLTGSSYNFFSPNTLLSFSPFILLIFIFLMLLGGSSNSTTGGIKIDRLILFIKSIFWRIKQTILPNIAYFPKKYNGEIIENSKIRALYFLILMYLFFIILGVFVLSFNGYPLEESTFEVISAQSNVGLSTGITAQDMPMSAKIMLTINMWVGRLEIIPILAVIGIIFSRKYNV